MFKKGNTRRNNHLIPDDYADISGFTKDQNLSFDEGIRIFIQECKIKNLSKYTLQFYKQKLRESVSLLYDIEPDLLPKNTRLQHIKEGIIIRLLEDEKSAVTVNTLLRSLRAFFNFLYNEGYININPVDKLKMLKENQKIVPTFSNEDLQVLFAQPDLKTFTGVRDYTIMLLMLDTGIRVRELCDIKIRDIDWKTGFITIQGKGFRQRDVPMQTTLKRQLDKYVRIRGDIIDTDALFVTIDNMPISRRQVHWRIRNYGKQANIKNVRVSPHTFRHTFARMSIVNGANIFALQRILGHSTLEMVRRYVAMFADEIALQHQKFSPVERLWR